MLDLAEHGSGLVSPVDDSQGSKKHLTWQQMAVFAGIRASEPMLFFCIFPYINEALLEYGISQDARTTGYAAGILESTASIATAVSIQMWSSLADKYGRKFVLLWSTLAASVVGGLVGLPRTFSMMLLLRFATGFLNGQAGIRKNYMAELVDQDNEASAFAFVGLAWQTGWCLAAIAGGYLSHPERHFAVLEKIPFIREYPYGLVTLSMAVLPILAVYFGFDYMQETLTPIRIKQAANQQHLRWSPEMWQAFRIFSAVCFCNVTFQACLPLFFYAPVDSGGLGLSTAAIAKWYAWRAVLIILIEMPVYPKLHRRFGHLLILRGQVSLYPFIFLSCPIISLCRKRDLSDSLGTLTGFLLVALLLVEAAAQTVFISGDLICTNAAPEQSQQSQFNAMVETGAKIATMAASWLGAWLFAYSAQSQYLSGYLIWLAAAALALLTCRLVFTYQEPAGWRANSSTPLTAMHDEPELP